MQFFKYSSENVRLTGRWHEEGDSVTTTAAGSCVACSFRGSMAVLHFDMNGNEEPCPHLWISADGGADVEAALQPYIRVRFGTAGVHTIRFTVKSEAETGSRWMRPLVDKVAWKGFEAEEGIAISPDWRRTIEFVGDSITEGVLVDAAYAVGADNRFNRVFQNDSMATYAYLTADLLNLTPIISGYGSVGVTKGGNGGVPKGALAYPYYYDGAAYEGSGADYIVVNYGANDRKAGEEAYLSGLEALLDVISKKNPASALVVLGAFCGAYADVTGEFVKKYNRERKKNVVYISSEGWISPEPLHPDREGHAICARRLAEAMRRLFPELSNGGSNCQAQEQEKA